MSERTNGRLLAWAALVGGVALLGYTARASGERPERDSLYLYSTAVAQAVFFAVILAIVLAIARGLPKARLLGLRQPHSWRRAVWIALGVFIAVVVLNALLDPLLHAGREQGLAPKRWEPSHAGAFAANFAVFALFGPVVEELTFRGVGFGLLLERFGQTAAILLVGVAFGVWHGLVDALPILAAFGVGLAYLRSRTGSIFPTIALHVAFNALALTLAVTL